MKKATEKIIKHFPLLEKHITDYDSVIFRDRVLDELDDLERVFLKLGWFFENPDQNDFDLSDLYSTIEGDWLSFALECIVYYFYKDTYLMKEPNFSLITDNTTFFNQSDFSEYLSKYKHEHNINFSRQLINTYSKRGVLPSPDLVVGRTKYWKKETCESYLMDLCSK